MKTQFYKLFIFSLFVIALGSCKKDPEMPTQVVNLDTNGAHDITATSAVVDAKAKANCTERGVCWGKAPNPTLDDFHIANGSGKGEYSCTLTDLEPNQKYYYRAYASDGKRYVYATDEKSFTTRDGIVHLTTGYVTDITATSATCSGNITDEAGCPVTERGICYGQSPNPTLEDAEHIAAGSGTGEFSVALADLTPGATYYVRAYATSILGTTYADDEKDFVTRDGIPVVATSDICDITATSATCGGNVDNAFALPVTECGVCYGTTTNPTLDDAKHEAFGSGLDDFHGSFTVSLADLAPNTKYYVRAYAINSLGTTYAQDEKSFTTDDGLPSVTTGNVSDETSTSATCSGIVTDDGGFAVTERGFCWSTNPNPTLENAQHFAAGSGTGGFSATLTGLTANTTYYVRAYATNSQGTSYGSDVSFTPGCLNFTANGVTFKMIYVEDGTFTMGATAEQGSEAEDDERPTHSVTLSSYYIGETEVTQALWQAVMGSNPSNFKGNNLPVEMVSWNDCQTFINKLNQLLAGQLNGRQFALPTEAQWEYAARGGKQSRGYKYCGSNTLDEVAWYDEDFYIDRPHVVGAKQANELGLYDMSGNVCEWCQDWFGSYSSSAETNPTGPSSGTHRVVRGGCWIDHAVNCRVSARYYIPPDSHYLNFGLRLALR